MERQHTPGHRKIYNDNEVSLGWFDQPFHRINIQDVLRRSHYLLSLISKYRKKQWFYFFTFNQDYLLAGVMFNGGYYCEYFIYVFDRSMEELIQFEGSSLLTPSMITIGTSSVESVSICRFENNLFTIAASEDGIVVTVDLKIREYRLFGSLELIEYGDPLVNVREIVNDRLVYTHQNSLMKALGKVRLIKGQYYTDIDFDEDSRGGIDFTVGYHAYRTDWYWASASGIDSFGNEVAINFASDIVITPESSNHIFCYWIGTDIFRKNENVNFIRLSETEWEITSPSIELVFTQKTQRSKRYFMGPLGYDYIQPIGTYVGRILHDIWLNVNLFGVFEEHYAAW